MGTPKIARRTKQAQRQRAQEAGTGQEASQGKNGAETRSGAAPAGEWAKDAENGIRRAMETMAFLAVPMRTALELCSLHDPTPGQRARVAEGKKVAGMVNRALSLVCANHWHHVLHSGGDGQVFLCVRAWQECLSLVRQEARKFQRGNPQADLDAVLAQRPDLRERILLDWVLQVAKKEGVEPLAFVRLRTPRGARLSVGQAAHELAALALHFHFHTPTAGSVRKACERYKAWLRTRAAGARLRE